MSAPLVGAVGLGATLFSGIAGVKGAEATGKAQQNQYEYQAGLAEINANISKENADYTRTAGELKAMQYGMAAGQRKGAIVAAQSASGLDINSGSNLDVRKSQEMLDKIDLDTMRSNTMRTAYGYNVQSEQYKNQAQLYRMGAADAAAATKTNVMSSILGTVSSVSSKWLTGNSLGMWGGTATAAGGSGSGSGGAF